MLTRMADFRIHVYGASETGGASHPSSGLRLTTTGRSEHPPPSTPGNGLRERGSVPADRPPRIPQPPARPPAPAVGRNSATDRRPGRGGTLPCRPGPATRDRV